MTLKCEFDREQSEELCLSKDVFVIGEPLVCDTRFVILHKEGRVHDAEEGVNENGNCCSINDRKADETRLSRQPPAPTGLQC